MGQPSHRRGFTATIAGQLEWGQMSANATDVLVVDAKLQHYLFGVIPQNKSVRPVLEVILAQVTKPYHRKYVVT